MKIKEKYYRFAEKGQQIQRVNRFFVTEYLIFYAFILFMLWASRAKGVRSLGFTAFVSVIAVVSGGALLIGWRRRPESERLRYLALIGLYLVSFFMTFAYTESFIRFLGLAPFIGCILFFDPKYSRIGGIGYLVLNALTVFGQIRQQDTALGGYQRWLDGQVAFYACGTWDVAAFMDDATFPYNWDLCGWPVGPNGDGKSTAWLGTVGFAVSSQAKNPDLCAELIQSLSTDLDGQKELCGETSGKSLQIPNIMDYAQTTFKDKVNDGTIPYASNVDVIFGYIEGSDKYKGIFTETTYTYNSEWWDTFLEGMPNVLTGEVSVDDYCKQVAPKMQEALDNAIELQNAATNN